MTKIKNFTINRTKVNDFTQPITSLNLGDVFEREGSLHMRVKSYVDTENEIPICNLSTGAVWCVQDTEIVTKVHNVKINYEVMR